MMMATTAKIGNKINIRFQSHLPFKKKLSDHHSVQRMILLGRGWLYRTLGKCDRSEKHIEKITLYESEVVMMIASLHLSNRVKLAIVQFSKGSTLPAHAIIFQRLKLGPDHPLYSTIGPLTICVLLRNLPSLNAL